MVEREEEKAEEQTGEASSPSKRPIPLSPSPHHTHHIDTTSPKPPTRLNPPEDSSPNWIFLPLTMYDEPYVPHVPLGLLHCHHITWPWGNKWDYTHTHTHTHPRSTIHKMSWLQDLTEKSLNQSSKLSAREQPARREGVKEFARLC